MHANSAELRSPLKGRDDQYIRLPGTEVNTGYPYLGYGQQYDRVVVEGLIIDA